MRELHDCTAEVFRRSKERIEKRRRRNRVAALCLPLVLCVSMAGVLHMSGWNDKGATEDATPTNAAPESSQSSAIRIHVTGGDVSLSHADPKAVQNILLQLDACSGVMAGGLLDSADSDPEGIAADETEGETTAPADVPRGWEDRESVTQNTTHVGYAITVILEDGSVLSYYLSDSTLEDLTKNETYPLTQAELDYLKELLGVS